MSIDTRTLQAGELYVAIRGERFDGAEFAGAAIDGGRGRCVVPRGWAAAAAAIERGRGGVVIEVDDTIEALQALAHAVRRESGAQGRGHHRQRRQDDDEGSDGEFLEARYRVIRNRGNLNNHIGLPLSLIELRQRPESPSSNWA